MDMLTMKYTRGILVDEGKTKEVHQVGNHPDLVRITSKDDITAGDGAKHDVLKKKGQFANETTCNVFRYLLKHKIPVAFLEQDSERSFIAFKCTMLPYEVVVRRQAHGSYLKRYPELKKGHIFQAPLVEFFLKTKNKKWKAYNLVCDDPLMCYKKFIGEIRLFDSSKPIRDQKPFLILSEEEVFEDREEWNNFPEMSRIALQAFRLLEKAWGLNGGKLVDYKVEFGFTSNDQLLLADVIDNDSWRVVKNGAYIDKQVYRDGGSLKDVIANYQQVAEITRRFLLPAKDK